jgi:hypothetical protein
MKRPLLCLLALLPFTAGVPVLALDWKTQQLTLKAAPLQKTAETTFEFTNTSAKTVTILGIDTSCDCTEATPSAQSFAPGASGRILARFTLGDRQGVYERSIAVRTDEAQEPVSLHVQLDVPELASLTPRSLEWKLNSPVTEQTVEIRVAAGLELTLNSVKPTSDFFTSRLETVEPGRLYRLHLAPRHTREVANAAFRLYAKAGTGQDVVLSAYGNVR